MNSLSAFEQGNQNGPDLHHRASKPQSPVKITELILAKPATEDDKKKDTSPFPDLKKRHAKERAKEIVDHLEELILNPDRLDGKTGTSYKSWAKTARKEIREAIQEAESSAAFRELISANRIGGLCMRIGFLLLATVSSFAAFWYGILFIWQEYGAIWGIGATLSAVGLSIAFTTAGLLFGGDHKTDATNKAVEKYSD
tara:strand:- start:105 stop:698 length:594 start_codon:yes stop_codon:yes gene_type:complete